jgi:PAS domain S-box-containing protein
MNSPRLPSASLATLRAWFDIAPDAMVAMDDDGNITLANAQAERMFGYDPGTLLGLTLEALLPESLRHAHRMHRDSYKAFPQVRPMGIGDELMGIRHDGEPFPVEIGLSPVSTERGVVVIASVRDISETRRVRQALERARWDTFLMQIGRLALVSSDYEVAIRQIPEQVAAALDVPAVVIFSTDWYHSELRVRASTGLSRDAAETLTSAFSAVRLIRTIFPNDDPGSVTMGMLRDGPYAAIGTTLATAGFHDIAMVPLFGRDEPLGALAALATAPARFDHDKVSFLQSVANLLTAAAQRGRSEEQLAHTRRLEVVGQLTGGIAHDFNNLLTIISGNLQLLESELPDRPEMQEIIDGALRAVDRGSDLTRRLLTFARRQPLKPRAVVPQPLLEELGHMLRRTLGETVLVEVECKVDVPDVYADPNELDTALVNLALNARDAMPRGGRLRIVAREVFLEGADNEWKLPAGHYVALDVGDNGTGMSPEVQAHAFEPFFTTKESGKGSGLGLSMVYGFVTQSGGAMSIDSRLGYGTRVTLMLPVPGKDAHRPEDTPATRDALDGRPHETILVVEDEADVRTIAVRFLSIVGYRVLSAASAKEAVDILLTKPEVDLLFSDVVLGSGMNGVELAQEAQRIRPGLAVLLTSGYRGHHDEHRDKDVREAFELLRKPYRREQLLGAIRCVLDRD